MKLRTTLLFLALAMTHALAHEDHHLDGGASAQTPGSPLVFSNGNDFSTESGWVMFLDGKDSTGMWYVGDELTVTSLSGSASTGGPAPGRAANGAFLQLQFLAVEGPAGSQMRISQEEFTPDEEPTGNILQLLDLPVGPVVGDQKIPITEGEGSPGSDPFGHIHGRQFWADRPGLFTATVRLVDTSTNGPGGGPIHIPSAPLSIYFQADDTVQIAYTSAGGAELVFAVRELETVALESSPQLGAGAAWTEVYRNEASDDSHVNRWPLMPGDTARFFRLHRNVTAQ